MKPAPPVMRIVSVTGRSLSSALFIVAFEQLNKPTRLAVRRLVLVQESGVVRLAPRPSVVSHVCGGCLGLAHGRRKLDRCGDQRIIIIFVPSIASRGPSGQPFLISRPALSPANIGCFRSPRKPGA